MNLLLPSRRAIASSFAFVLALHALCPRAWTAEDPEALIRQGVELRKAGDDAKAQGYFQRAYEVAKTPRSAAQLGLVEFALKRWSPAEVHLSEALRADDDAWIRTNRDALDVSLTEVRRHLGCLVIIGAPVGARVKIADVDRGILPLQECVYVAPGAVIVSVSADRYVSLQRMVRVLAGQQDQVDIKLFPLTETAPSPAVGGTGQSSRTERPDGWMRPAAWTSAAGAVALLGVGGVALAASNRNYTDFNNQVFPGTTIRQCNKQAATRGGGSCQQLLSTGDHERVLAIVGFSVGTLAGVTSAFLFAASSKGTPFHDSAISCAPDFLFTAGGTCEMRF